jgi:hypothetical protein
MNPRQKSKVRGRLEKGSKVTGVTEETAATSAWRLFLLTLTSRDVVLVPASLLAPLASYMRYESRFSCWMQSTLAGFDRALFLRVGRTRDSVSRSGGR